MKKFYLLSILLLGVVTLSAQSPIRQGSRKVVAKKYSDPAEQFQQRMKKADADRKKLRETFKSGQAENRQITASAKSSILCDSETGTPTWKLDYTKSTDGKVTTFTYDSEGRILTSTGTDATTTYEYDDEGGYTSTEITANGNKYVERYDVEEKLLLWASYIKDSKGEWFLTEKTEREYGGDTYRLIFDQNTIWVDSLNQYVITYQDKDILDENGKTTLTETTEYVDSLKANVVTYRDEYQYDDNGNKTQSISYSYDNATKLFLPTEREAWTYDAENRQTSNKLYKYDSEGNEYWYSEYDCDYTNPAYAMWERWLSPVGAYTELLRSDGEEYGYDSDGNTIMTAQYDYDGTSFNLTFKETVEYDSQGRILNDIYGSVSEGQFVLDETNKDVYSYDGDNYNYSAITGYHLTNADPETWIENNKLEYTYNADGQRVSSTSYDYDADTQSYVKMTFEEITYNDFGMYQQIKYYSWDGDSKVLTGYQDYTYDDEGNRISMTANKIVNGKPIVIEKSTYYSNGYQKLYYSVWQWDEETGDVISDYTEVNDEIGNYIASVSTDEETKLSYTTDDEGLFTEVKVTDSEGNPVTRTVLDHNTGMPLTVGWEVYEGTSQVAEKTYYIPVSIMEDCVDTYTTETFSGDYTDTNTHSLEVYNFEGYVLAEYHYGFINGKLAVSSYTTYDRDENNMVACETSYRNDNFAKGEEGEATLYSTKAYDFDYDVPASDIAWNLPFAYKVNSYTYEVQGEEQTRTDYVYTQFSDEPAIPTAVSSVKAAAVTSNKVIKTNRGIIYNGRRYNFDGQQVK